MMSTGLGPFYDGLVHLFVTPADLLPVVALALLSGLRGAAWGRAVLLGLPLAWLVGSVATALVVLPSLPPAMAAATAVAIGALVAADVKLPLGVLAGGAIALGLATGAGSSPGIAMSVASGLFAVGGTASLFVVVALLAGQVASLQADAARIAVRVAGSWIAAIGFLALGWALR